MDKFGFIGLGSMGEPMAARLAIAGLKPVVYDQRLEPAQRIEKLGGVIASSPEDVGRACDVIEVIVVDDAQVRQVVLGDGTSPGVLDGCSPGNVIAIHSTIPPATAIELAALAAQREVGVIDAPVSGAVTGATDGTLAIMVGGDSSHLERCKPVFTHLAENIFHVGDIGMGLVAKLVNNLVALVNGQTLAEGLALANTAGLDTSRMLEILNVSTGRSWGSEIHETLRDIARNNPDGSKNLGRIIKKDMSLALELGKELGVPLIIAEQADKKLEG